MNGVNKPSNRFTKAENFGQATENSETVAPIPEVSASPKKAPAKTKKADKTEKQKTTQQIRTERGLLRIGIEVDEETRDKVALTVVQNKKRFKNQREFILRCIEFGFKHPDKI